MLHLMILFTLLMFSEIRLRAIVSMWKKNKNRLIKRNTLVCIRNLNTLLIKFYSSVFCLMSEWTLSFLTVSF